MFIPGIRVSRTDTWILAMPFAIPTTANCRLRMRSLRRSEGARERTRGSHMELYVSHCWKLLIWINKMFISRGRLDMNPMFIFRCGRRHFQSRIEYWKRSPNKIGELLSVMMISGTSQIYHTHTHISIYQFICILVGCSRALPLPLRCAHSFSRISDSDSVPCQYLTRALFANVCENRS